MPFQPLSSGQKLEQQIRERFFKWYKDSGMTQADAGKSIEWGQQTVSAYFAGEQQIDLVRAIVWCGTFGYTVTDLLSKAASVKPSNPLIKVVLDGFNRQSPAMQRALAVMMDELPGRARRRADKPGERRVAGQRG